MSEDKEDKETNRRRSVFESLPSYLAGCAAVATATVGVLTYLRHRDVETTPITETEINHDHVGAVPSLEVRPAKAGNAKGAASQTAPSLESALHPTRCAGYVGGWKLSSGEQLSLLDNERVEIKTEGAAPRFGRWNCSGRNEEILYVTLDRSNSTLTFDASGDGKSLYQRADQRTPTPLSATRASQP
jgi:hypothetical protein